MFITTYLIPTDGHLGYCNEYYSCTFVIIHFLDYFFGKNSQKKINRLYVNNGAVRDADPTHPQSKICIQLLTLQKCGCPSVPARDEFQDPPPPPQNTKSPDAQIPYIKWRR